MKITASIKVFGDAKDLEKLFLSENSDMNNGRARYSFKTEGNDFLITIKAEDATAFRAVISSVTKLLSIYEKTNAVMNNERK
jgi:tRNA threonylcarbamoyladenosine modification (KEOPS) complex  Pcc1 subunit